MRYDRAVGRQAQPRQPRSMTRVVNVTPTLGWMPLIDWGWSPPQRLPESKAVRNYWNAGVNQAYGGSGSLYERRNTNTLRQGGDTYRKPKVETSWWSSLFNGDPSVSPTNLDRATVYMQYGNVGGARHELGDLFNDIMGSIVPGWDERPQVLKDLRLKVDPNKVLNAAQKLAPGAGGKIVQAANAAGLDVWVNTPAGPVLVSPEMAQGAYANYSYYTQAQSAVSGIFSSPMTLLAVGGIGLGLFLMLKR